MAGGIGAAIVGSTLFGSTALATAAAVAINAALYIGLSIASNALLRPNAGQTRAREIIIRSGAQPKVIIFGETVVAGVLFYMNQKPISGDQNFELWAGVVHAGHECEDITNIYYETDLIQPTWVSNKATVDSGPWFADDATHEASTAYRFLGTSTQSLHTDFTGAFTELSAAHRLRGYSGTVHRFQIFDESEEVFSGGHPQNIRSKVKGHKCYDSRLDSTNGGTGSHRYTDQSTWEYTDNSVLCAITYMILYWRRGGVDPTRFDWAYNADQADRCDVVVSVPSGTQKRYTCNGALSLGDSGNVNLGKILATCLGKRTTVNGKIRITVGDFQTADVTLGEADIIGKVKVRPAVPRAERYNRVDGTYFSELNDYAQTEFLPVNNAGFVSRDNGELIPKPLQLDMVSNEYQAQRIAFKDLQQSDQQLSVELPLRWSGLRLTPGTYASVTHSKFNWVNKIFKCERLKIGERGIPVTAVMREDSSTAWTDPTVGQYSTRSAFGVVVPATKVVPPPTSFVVNPAVEGRIGSWVNPTGRESWDFTRVYKSPDSTWANAVLWKDEIRDEQFFDPDTVGVTAYYWIVSVKNGIESLREPNSDTSDRSATAAGADWATLTNVPSGQQSWFYQSAAPTADGTGDFWLDSDDNKLFRWNGSAWVDVQDDEIAQAILDAFNAQSDADTAQTTADTKIVTFRQSAQPTADGVGDIWLDTDDDKLYRWNGTTWENIQDDDIAQGIADAAAAQAAADAAQATADGKIVTFKQATAPTADGFGDFWIDDDDDKLYRWNGTTWELVQDDDIATAITNAATAQSTADGKIITFVSATAPTADGVGDLWIDTDDDKMYRWSGSAWVDYSYDRAIWANVTGTGVPEDNATENVITSGTATPTGGSSGDLYHETDSNRYWMNIGGTWTIIASENNITSGSGAPTGGAHGDIYQRTDTKRFYYNINGTWFIIGGALGGSDLVTDGLVTNSELSGFKFKDVTITGGKIADVTLTGAKIGDDEITVPAGSYSAGGVTTNNDTTDVDIITVTLDPGGQPCMILYSGVKSRSGNDADYYIGLKRDTTAVVAVTELASRDIDKAQLVSVMYFDSSTALGSRTYKIVARSGDSNDTLTFSKNNVMAVGLKK